MHVQSLAIFLLSFSTFLALVIISFSTMPTLRLPIWAIIVLTTMPTIILLANSKSFLPFIKALFRTKSIVISSGYIPLYFKFFLTDRTDKGYSSPSIQSYQWGSTFPTKAMLAMIPFFGWFSTLRAIQCQWFLSGFSSLTSTRHTSKTIHAFKLLATINTFWHGLRPCIVGASFRAVFLFSPRFWNLKRCITSLTYLLNINGCFLFNSFGRGMIALRTAKPCSCFGFLRSKFVLFIAIFTDNFYSLSSGYASFTSSTLMAKAGTPIASWAFRWLATINAISRYCSWFRHKNIPFSDACPFVTTQIDNAKRDYVLNNNTCFGANFYLCGKDIIA